MRRRSKRRDMISLIVSATLHVGLVLALALIPKETRKSYETVDLSVSKTKKKAEPEPEEKPEEETPEVEPEPEPEPKKPKPKRPRKAEPEPEPEESSPPPLQPAEETEVPKDAPEAPPVFDLGDNSFATEGGQGAAWSLNRSEGNTKFAPIAKKKQSSVRGTKAVGSKKGKPGGTGPVYAPVPIKNLSKRPKPKNGNISMPTYPSKARDEGIEGKVVLQVFISKHGRVTRVRIMQEPGGGLGQAARRSMLGEKWTLPLDKKGRPVATVITYSYRFVLDG
ncbi:MAG: energy transducer TonB [Deltaproteobacteria bacterium]|nr:energy transducer TonB [Deltaproteobacteria bacterium]